MAICQGGRPGFRLRPGTVCQNICPRASAGERRCLVWRSPFVSLSHYFSLYFSLASSGSTHDHCAWQVLSYETTYKIMSTGNINAMQHPVPSAQSSIDGKSCQPAKTAGPERLAMSTQIYAPQSKSQGASPLSPLSPLSPRLQATSGSKNPEQDGQMDAPLTVTQLFLGSTSKRVHGSRLGGRDIQHKAISRQGKKIAPPTLIEALEETARLETGEIMRADLFEPRAWPLRSPRTAAGGSPRSAWGGASAGGGQWAGFEEDPPNGQDLRISCRGYWHEFRGPDPLRPLPIEPFRAQAAA